MSWAEIITWGRGYPILLFMFPSRQCIVHVPVGQEPDILRNRSSLSSAALSHQYFSSRGWPLPLPKPACTHLLGFFNYAFGEHRQNRESETTHSLLKAITMWYIVPALLHSQDGRVKRHERFAPAERGEITLRLPWLMEYTRRASIAKA